MGSREAMPSLKIQQTRSPLTSTLRGGMEDAAG